MFIINFVALVWVICIVWFIILIVKAVDFDNSPNRKETLIERNTHNEIQSEDSGLPSIDWTLRNWLKSHLQREQWEEENPFEAPGSTELYRLLCIERGAFELYRVVSEDKEVDEHHIFYKDKLESWD